MRHASYRKTCQPVYCFCLQKWIITNNAIHISAVLSFMRTLSAPKGMPSTSIYWFLVSIFHNFFISSVVVVFFFFVRFFAVLHSILFVAMVFCGKFLIGKSLHLSKYQIQCNCTNSATTLNNHLLKGIVTLAA